MTTYRPFGRLAWIPRLRNTSKRRSTSERCSSESSQHPESPSHLIRSSTSNRRSSPSHCNTPKRRSTPSRRSTPAAPCNAAAPRNAVAPALPQHPESSQHPDRSQHGFPRWVEGRLPSGPRAQPGQRFRRLEFHPRGCHSGTGGSREGPASAGGRDRTGRPVSSGVARVTHLSPQRTPSRRRSPSPAAVPFSPP